MLELHRLAGRRGDRLLFKDLDLRLEPGEALWLQGPNGSGKTSLLRLICGLSQPAAGQVSWKGQDIARLREDLHRDLLWQGDAPALKDDLSALENLLFAERLAGRPCDRADARSALAQLGLDGVADLPARWLSQGQRRRAALARLHLGRQPAAGGPARLLVLDEPFNGLDAAATTAVEATLNAHLAGGSIVVYTTHLPQRLRAQRLHVLTLGAAIATC